MEEVWAEDGEGKSMSSSLLSMHHGCRLPGPQTSMYHYPGINFSFLESLGKMGWDSSDHCHSTVNRYKDVRRIGAFSSLHMKAITTTRCLRQR